MRQAVYQRQRQERVHVFDASTMPWEATARPGLRLKTIRVDDDRGEFLGQIGFDPFVRSGLHQHQGVATSFILEGGLCDYQGHVALNEVGINYLGSTHDAIAYVPTVLVSKLEGVVTYPPEDGLLSGVHAGSTYRSFRNEAPDVAPEINIAVDRVEAVESGVAGLRRQPVYDYAGSGTTRRLLQWRLRPHTVVPAWQASDWVELWVRGGEMSVNGQKAHANCFVVVEPGATVRIEAPFGALALVWAEGSERWPATGSAGASGSASLFGF
jgi:hypothetical protein